MLYFTSSLSQLLCGPCTLRRGALGGTGSHQHWSIASTPATLQTSGRTTQSCRSSSRSEACQRPGVEGAGRMQIPGRLWLRLNSWPSPVLEVLDPGPALPGACTYGAAHLGFN